MLSKTRYTQLAAIAALTVLFGANASMTTARAQTGMQPAQTDKKEMKDSQKGDVKSSSGARRQAQSEQKSSKDEMRRSKRQSTSSGESTRVKVRSDRHKETVGEKTKTRTVIKHRDSDRRVVVFHSRPRTTVTFVVLGPRRHYRPGWCRGLHRGTHWAPGIGWHAGRHFGRFRC